MSIILRVFQPAVDFHITCDVNGVRKMPAPYPFLDEVRTPVLSPSVVPVCEARALLILVFERTCGRVCSCIRVCACVGRCVSVCVCECVYRCVGNKLDVCAPAEVSAQSPDGIRLRLIIARSGDQNARLPASHAPSHHSPTHGPVIKSNKPTNYTQKQADTRTHIRGAPHTHTHTAHPVRECDA